jgi:hypothetical protein
MENNKNAVNTDTDCLMITQSLKSTIMIGTFIRMSSEIQWAHELFERRRIAHLIYL